MEASDFEPKPFQKWLTNLRKRGHSRSSSTPTKPVFQHDHWLLSLDGTSSQRMRPKRPVSASEASSMGFVTGIQTASVTTASASVLPASKKLGHLGYIRTRSAGRSSEEGRGSSDSNAVTRPLMDQIALSRAIQRQKILEELISSEESYIADLKVLINVYVTLLASVSAVSAQIRASICENVGQILQLHEKLLLQLHQAIPNSEYHDGEASASKNHCSPGHVRWHSADNAVAKARPSPLARKFRRSLDIPRPQDRYPVGLIADPKTASAVAQVFDDNMIHFFIYEEYGAKYETMMKDLATTYKSVSSKDSFEKGIEVLSRTLASINNREGQDRKGLTFGDLLIKPIQRICKYPLLFADLCKNTPVADDPEAHAEISKALLRLKETTREINRATDDPKARQMIEKTWLLQDRLVFENSTSQAVTARILGHMLLCGVLYVAYQSSDGVKGNYTLCALFKSCLLLGLADKNFSTFTVVASIPLMSVGVEDPDNGRGLQCHTAPHSFKLVFEMNYQLFEIMLTACSAKEEEEWRRHLETGISNEQQNSDGASERWRATDILSSLTLDLSPIGNMYGPPHTIARKLSIRRALTLNPKPCHMSQVVIKNTQARNTVSGLSQQADSTTSLPIVRSQSMLSSAANIPTLAPRRSERSQLESALSDVWSKDILPYPGMGPRRNDIRASANNVMRKLSMANLSANFNKRASTDDEKIAMLKRKESKKELTAPSKIDFQNSPENFLPPDFGIEAIRENRKKKTWFWR